jgi:hypothetical protein
MRLVGLSQPASTALYGSVDAELVVLRVGHDDAVGAPFLQRTQHPGTVPTQAVDLGVDGVAAILLLQTDRHP